MFKSFLYYYDISLQAGRGSVQIRYLSAWNAQICPNDTFFKSTMADIASDTALQHLESLYPYGQVTSSSDGNSN